MHRQPLQHRQDGGLTGGGKEGRIHRPGGAEQVGGQIGVFGQPGSPLHHRLHQGQALLRPQAPQQLHPGPGIGRVPQQPLQGHTLSGHGLDQIGAGALLLQQAGEALTQELEQVGRQGGRLDGQGGQQPLPVGGRFSHQRHQIQRPAPIPEDLQQAIAGTAQGIGIGGAAGPLAPGEDAQQQLQTLGQGEHGTRLRPRQGVAGAAGLVMLQHRQGHGAGFPLRQQVLGPHHPLQLREFPHHLADQVVLAERGGPAGGAGGLIADLQAAAEQLRQPGQAPAAIGQAAQPFGKGDPVEGLHPLGAALAAIRRQEKGGVRQPCPQHPLVTTLNRGGGGLQAIGDAQEARQQHPFGDQGQGIARGR